MLDLLARHPSTATFIATKLARRFVADDPPEALVARAAATFRRSDGNLREVVRTIVTSPEMHADASRGAKVKSPLEFVVSALRATGADVRDTRALAQQLRTLGQPLYYAQPPTGYPDDSQTWVSTGTLLARMNSAVALAGCAAAASTGDGRGSRRSSGTTAATWRSPPIAGTCSAR